MLPRSERYAVFFPRKPFNASLGYFLPQIFCLQGSLFSVRSLPARFFHPFWMICCVNKHFHETFCTLLLSAQRHQVMCGMHRDWQIFAPVLLIYAPCFQPREDVFPRHCQSSPSTTLGTTNRTRFLAPLVPLVALGRLLDKVLEEICFAFFVGACQCPL